jgi:two-component system chemotaxis response regulator CheB
MNKKKVLVIDDSALVRKLLSEVINNSNDFEVVDTAMDPIFALNKLQKYDIDIITLDIEMPRMDGISFLQKIMTENPIPVIVISSLTSKNADVTLKALSLGAFDYILKPQNLTDLSSLSKTIINKLSHACKSKIPTKLKSIIVKKDDTSHFNFPKDHFTRQYNTTDKIIAIGSSTGGTVAIERILEKLPPTVPGIVIVQHMPKQFTKAFADRLNSIYSLNIKEAENNDRIVSGSVYIAPGDKHMVIKPSGGHYHIGIIDGPLVNGHKPSVATLFNSIAHHCPKNTIGVMLTGMGEDGSKAMRYMRDEGSYNIVQDEATSVVFGMPKKAIEYGAAHKVLPIHEISKHILDII